MGKGWNDPAVQGHRPVSALQAVEKTGQVRAFLVHEALCKLKASLPSS